jgi:two-component system, cell cycle response regulator DivK
MKISSPPLVLLVEDHPDTRDLYAAYLSLMGFSVQTARNGMEGFTRACESRPDVLVTDLIMPNIDGFELVRRLRADRRTTLIPIVIVTGWTVASVQKTARQLGCASYLLKPCLPEVLADEIQRVLAYQAVAPAV